MLTIEDIRNPACATGFKYVTYTAGGSANAGGGQTTRRYWAGKRIGENRYGWRGPRRATAREAAQDYCDYINGQQAPPQPKLKSVDRKRRARETGPAMTARERALRAELRPLVERRKKAQQAPGFRGFIYFVAEGQPNAKVEVDDDAIIENYAVKIGWSEDYPDVTGGRLDGLQTSNPRPLILLNTRSGTRDDEKALHNKYISANVLGEWFRPTPAVLSEFGWRIEWRGSTFYRIVRED